MVFAPEQFSWILQYWKKHQLGEGEISPAIEPGSRQEGSQRLGGGNQATSRTALALWLRNSPLSTV
jgi:hypothetical protein